MMLNVLLILRAFLKLVFNLIQNCLIGGTRNLYLDFFTFLYHYIVSVKSDSVSWEVLVQLNPLHSLHPSSQGHVFYMYDVLCHNFVACNCT